jgi:hypothetical protein
MAASVVRRRLSEYPNDFMAEEFHDRRKILPAAIASQIVDIAGPVNGSDATLTPARSGKLD